MFRRMAPAVLDPLVRGQSRMLGSRWRGRVEPVSEAMLERPMGGAEASVGAEAPFATAATAATAATEPISEHARHARTHASPRQAPPAVGPPGAPGPAPPGQPGAPPTHGRGARPPQPAAGRPFAVPAFVPA